MCGFYSAPEFSTLFKANPRYDATQPSKSRCRIAYDSEGTSFYVGSPVKIGSIKLADCVADYSQAPVITCPDCESCRGSCYATRGNFLYAEAHNLLLANTFYLFNNREKLFTDIQTAINSLPDSVRFFRIHVAGDMVDQDNLDRWARVVAENKNLYFYTYTKNNAIDWTTICSLPNFNLVHSLLPNGERNYGSLEYCRSIIADYKKHGINVALCPNNTKDRNGKKRKVQCGNCKICALFKYVVFIIH